MLSTTVLLSVSRACLIAQLVLYCTVLYCVVLCCTAGVYGLPHCSVLYCTVLYCDALQVSMFASLFCTVLYCTVLYCRCLWFASLFSSVLYRVVLCCTAGSMVCLIVLYYTVLYCTVLYCRYLWFASLLWRHIRSMQLCAQVTDIGCISRVSLLCYFNAVSAVFFTLDMSELLHYPTFSFLNWLHCTLNLAAQCIVISSVCGGRPGSVCLWVCGSVTMITRNCLHWSSPNWVCR